MNKPDPARRAQRLPQLFRIEDLAISLAVCKRTIYNLIGDKRLRPVKIGGSLRFREDDVLALIEAGSQVRQDAP